MLSMSFEPLVTVTVTEVGPFFEPKWQTRVLVSGPVAVLVTVPHGTVIEYVPAALVVPDPAPAVTATPARAFLGLGLPPLKALPLTVPVQGVVVVVVVPPPEFTAGAQ